MIEGDEEEEDEGFADFTVDEEEEEEGEEQEEEEGDEWEEEEGFADFTVDEDEFEEEDEGGEFKEDDDDERGVLCVLHTLLAFESCSRSDALTLLPPLPPPPPLPQALRLAAMRTQDQRCSQVCAAGGATRVRITHNLTAAWACAVGCCR